MMIFTNDYTLTVTDDALIFEIFFQLYDAFGDITTTLILAFVFTIFYELPLVKTEGLLFKPTKKGMCCFHNFISFNF